MGNICISESKSGRAQRLAEDRQIQLAEEQRQARLAEEQKRWQDEEQRRRQDEDQRRRQNEEQWRRQEEEQKLKVLTEQQTKSELRNENIRTDENQTSLVRAHEKLSPAATSARNISTPTVLSEIIPVVRDLHLNDFKTCIKFEKSKIQSAIYQTILQSNQAANFQCSRKISRNYRLLISHSVEYKEIASIFLNSCAPSLRIEQIFSVENPLLLGNYLLKKATLQARYGRNRVHERLLFHGTKACNGDSICHNNLDWRLCGTNIGNRFGQGMSFARHAKYAAFYSDKRHNYKKIMFVFRVAVGPICQGNAKMFLPPKWDRFLPFSNTKKPNGDVIVVYSDNEFYPAYKIVFTGDVNNLRRPQ